MTTGEIVLGLVSVAGVAGCVVLAWYLVRARVGLGHAVGERAREREGRERAEAALAEARETIEQQSRRVVELSEQVAALRERLENAELVRQELVRDRERVKKEFEILSQQVLRASREDFLKMAQQAFRSERELSRKELDARREAVEKMIEPISKVLGETRERLARLDERVAQSREASEGVREETQRLVRALSRPEIRGQYGEIQLRRVAELAGMRSWCDFTEQEHTRGADGSLLRPDMVVRMPAGRVIAVDAKTNTHAYLEAVNAQSEEERQAHLDRFARHVADQVKKLGDKGYWSAFEESVDFVVMFVPGDHFIDAALSRRSDLIELAAERNVILASPSTLIGLLRAVAVGWREHQLAEEAQELFRLGRELHERAAVVFEHASSLGRAVQATVDRFNRMTGSMASRLVPTLRRFEEAGAKSAKELAEIRQVEGRVRGADGEEA